MRRFLSIALLLLACLPMAASLLAQTQPAPGGVAQCCLRSGKHHCAGMASAQAAAEDGTPLWNATPEHCPCHLSHAVLPHWSSFAPPAAPALYAEVLSHPAAAPQAECMRRIALDRARGKRGPPAEQSL